MLTAGILTVSDSASEGRREDESGSVLLAGLEEMGFEVKARAILPDEADEIRKVLIEWADREALGLVVTTGGTGPGPRDVTPEATRSVMERELPGIAEALRIKGLEHTPFAMLSRGVAGIRRRTLIVNLPGSPKAVRQGLEILRPVLVHAVRKVQGDPTPCAGTPD